MTDTPFLDLLRHGTVAGPPALYGQTDVAPDPAGWDAFSPLFAAEFSCPYAAVVTSPLQRCAKVAKRFAEQHGLPLHTVPDLQEMDFGDWDGVAFSDLESQWAALGQFREDPAHHSPPQGETLTAFCQRVERGWQEIQAISRDMGSLLVVCHAGTIRVMIAQILGIDPKIGSFHRCLGISYASRTRIRLYPHEAVLEQISHVL